MRGKTPLSSPGRAATRHAKRRLSGLVPYRPQSRQASDERQRARDDRPRPDHRELPSLDARPRSAASASGQSGARRVTPSVFAPARRADRRSWRASSAPPRCAHRRRSGGACPPMPQPEAPRAALGPARRDPGAAGPRGGARPRLPPVAGGAPGRLRGGRRLLRHLGLPHHLAAAARGRARRVGLAARLLGASRAAHPAGRAADRARVRAGHRRLRAADPLAAVLRGDARQHGLRAELAARGRRRRLPRRRQRALARPALLVAVDRGAVLPRVAGADRRRARRHAGPAGAGAPPAGRAGAGGRDRAEPRLLDRPHGRRPGRRLLRHAHARLGARRRRAARPGRALRSIARRRARRPLMGRARRHRRGGARLQPRDALPGPRRPAARARSARGDPRRHAGRALVAGARS